MTIHYPSLEAACRDRPVRIADWGYFKCRDTDLAASGVKFFDDVEDPGHCRRAAFAGSSGSLVVLTVYGDSKGNDVVFACDAKVAGKSDLLNVLPEQFHRWVDVFEVVYFGQPV
ncbi:hypothetical protein [Burkholderia stagnalis]|uniref:hypothetical protein n=1 Tax=Burkholderia stagnalis TaxID=1503054 RepID=UPI000B05BB53|nr:hypothetical protein [Burkholderia stagnalis]